jgi:hypothetical protein
MNLKHVCYRSRRMFSWFKGKTVVGEAGAPGPAGAIGTQGTQGPAGPSGLKEEELVELMKKYLKPTTFKSVVK